MNVIIIRGPCGCGKTFLRKKKYPDILCHDMDDLRQYIEGQGITDSYENYLARMEELHKRILDSLTSKDVPPLTIIEGIFAPGSHSWRWLCGMLRNMAISYTWEIPEYTLASAMQNLLNDYEKDGNIERLHERQMLLTMYHKKFQ